MMSSGSTVFFFDFDIFSIGPIVDRLVAIDHAGAALAADHLDLHLGRRHVSAVRLLIGLVHHHALREHAGERLVHADMAGRLHRAGEEAAVEQMQDRVLDAADILVDRHHPVGHVKRGRRVLVPGIGEARKVPGRIHEGVHGVGFALGLAPHFGQVTCFQVG